MSNITYELKLKSNTFTISLKSLATSETLEYTDLAI